MTGLEKITERILAEAREKARVILQEAEEDCTRIATEYAERTESAREEISAKGMADGEKLVEDARAMAVTMREQILADARNAVLAQVMEGAKKKLCSSEQNRYRELLIALLTSALLEEGACEEPDAIDVLMNGLDHDTFGPAVVDAARKRVERRIGGEKAAKIRLCHEQASIDGGLMIRMGEQTIDCSIDTLLQRTCEQMKAELDELLFSE